MKNKIAAKFLGWRVKNIKALFVT